VTEDKKQKNLKSHLVGLGEWYINEVVLASKAEDILANATETPQRLAEVREAIATKEAEAIEAGCQPDNVAKMLQQFFPAVKDLYAEAKRLEDAEGRVFEAGMALIRERIPATILDNLELTFEPTPDADLPIRFNIGRMKSGGTGSRGFTAEWQGHNFVYGLPKHNARADLKVTKDGKGYVSIVTDIGVKTVNDGKGKATSHEVTSPSQAAMLLHDAVGLVKDDGSPWAPKTEVWQKS